jgi:hypothetical protein
MRKLKDGSPAGYGNRDREMAEVLAKAPTRAEADKIAQADGHKDAAGARKWLRDRS